MCTESAEAGSSIQNVDLHLHLRLDFSFQIKLGEGTKQTHVAMYASVDIAEYIFYKGLQEGERGASGLDDGGRVPSSWVIHSLITRVGAGTVAADVAFRRTPPNSLSMSRGCRAS